MNHLFSRLQPTGSGIPAPQCQQMQCEKSRTTRLIQPTLIVLLPIYRRKELVMYHCQRCIELEAENRRLRSELEARKTVNRIFQKAVVADYEWRGFAHPDLYLGEIFIAQVKREADYA